ncbi:MAG TPA: hypothetical protein PKN54_00375 [Candidatus Cloacimonas acidaminovorans]|nr:hypothetical protein [Candidatus Cloacimonas acidaminovorans]
MQIHEAIAGIVHFDLERIELIIVNKSMKEQRDEILKNYKAEVSTFKKI